MINQIHPVQTKTEQLPSLNKGLIQARHIQSQLKDRFGGASRPSYGEIWSPMIAGPYLVPVTRWIE